MATLATTADERVAGVSFDEDRVIVDLMDGRTISAPYAWYPRLFDATVVQRRNWRITGAGFAIHWPDIDEDLRTEGLLRGALRRAARARCRGFKFGRLSLRMRNWASNEGHVA